MSQFYCHIHIVLKSNRHFVQYLSTVSFICFGWILRARSIAKFRYPVAIGLGRFSPSSIYSLVLISTFLSSVRLSVQKLFEQSTFRAFLTCPYHLNYFIPIPSTVFFHLSKRQSTLYIQYS